MRTSKQEANNVMENGAHNTDLRAELETLGAILQELISYPLSLTLEKPSHVDC